MRSSVLKRSSHGAFAVIGMRCAYGPGVPSTNGSQSATVYLAEDDAALRALLTATLRKEGFTVVPVADGWELLASLEAARHSHESEPRLVITDIRMNQLHGLDALWAIKRVGCQAPVIVMTAFGDDELHERARRLGAVAVFDKPFDIDDLLSAARYHTQTAH